MKLLRPHISFSLLLEFCLAFHHSCASCLLSQMSAIVDFVEVMQPCMCIKRQLSIMKMQWGVYMLLQCLYMAKDKYPAAIHTSNIVYTTSTQHTQIFTSLALS